MGKRTITHIVYSKAELKLMATKVTAVLHELSELCGSFKISLYTLATLGLIGLFGGLRSGTKIKATIQNLYM